MKKILFALFGCFFALCACAGDDKDLMLFEVGGQVFYLKDLSLLESLIGNDSCITDETNGNIIKLYEILYSACKDGMGQMIDGVELSRNPRVESKQRGAMKMLNKLRDLGAKAGSSEKLFGDNFIGARQKVLANTLKNCLVEKETLRKALTKQQQTTKMKVTADIDKCIAQIQIDPTLSNGDSCPLVSTISDKKYIESLLDLNSVYRGQEFSFPVTGALNQNKVIVFNGNLLVACEGDKPVYLAKPTFSGRESCQNGQYQDIPGFGGTPNGIYVVVQPDNDFEPLPEKDWATWGQYKVPLIPAVETNTFGRTNMYIHGTSDPDKHRSGGCISLGIAVDRFIKTGFIKGIVPVIVNTDVVYQDWK